MFRPPNKALGTFTIEENMEYLRRMRGVLEEEKIFWSRMFGLTKGYVWLFAASFALTIVAQTINFFPIVVMKDFGDLLGAGVPDSEDGRLRVFSTIGILGVSMVLSAGIGRLSGFASRRLNLRVRTRLRTSVMDHLLRLSLGFHTAKDSSHNASVARDGVSAVTDGMWGLLVSLIPSIWNTLVYAVGIYVLVGKLGALVFAYQVFLFAYALMTQRWLSAQRTERDDRQRATGTFIADALRNIRLIKSSAMEANIGADVSRRNDDYVRISDALARRLVGIDLAQVLLQSIFMAIVLSVAAYAWLQGEVSVGAIFAIIDSARRLTFANEMVLSGYQDIKENVPAIQKLFELLDVKPDVLPPANPIPLGRMVGSISFEHVSFAYPGTVGTLHDVSFHVPAGKTVAIVGKTGAGKTTVSTLVLRGFDPDEGCVLIDGKDVRELDMVEYLSQVGTVSQGAGLLSTTVRANISFGIENATQEVIEDAARLAGAHKFILKLPNGYDTLVGENGAKLSGGQAQRICIARALIRDPRLLILDEATSHLDIETEAEIMKAMEDVVSRLNGTRAVIIIAHRLSTIRNADIVIVLDQGRIVQQGPYEQVRNEPGPFARMVELQLENARL